jgi:anionic cell wall polymer biosynthesis LytR-Cps2A-Psr (LCP) family protein
LDGSGEEFPTPLHWRRKRLGVLVVSVGFVVGLTVQNLQSMLGTVESPGAPAPVLQDIGEIDGGFNVLMAGLDTREGQGEGFEFVNTEVNDVNLLVHISENREHALVVIFPRDLLLDVPACSQPDGAESNPREIAAAKRR